MFAANGAFVPASWRLNWDEKSLASVFGYLPMLRFAFGSLALVSAGLLALAAPPTEAQKKTAADIDAFFASGRIPNLTMTLDPKDAESLRREPRKYVKATLKDGDKTYKDLAVHLRGSAGSFRGFDDKPGLTLNMDKFTDGLSYEGMDKLHLANSAQDPSFLSELIAGEICKAAGVPAARISHATLKLNDRKLGFYYLKEGYDKNFLRRHFKSTNGNFYDGGFLRDINQPLELISTKNDVKDHKDLKALVDACNEPDRAKRFERMEKLLDLDQFLSYLVVQVFMWDWDGYAMNPNNYRIYHDTDRDKLLFVPSGMDQMFGDINGTILPGFRGMVARSLIETPEGKKRYIDRFRSFMKDNYKPDELIKVLDAAEKRVQAAMAAVDANQARDHKNHVERLRQALKNRAKVVNDQLANYETWAGKPIDNEGYFRNWLVLSPVPSDAPDSTQAVDKQQIKDEAKLEPKEGDKVKVGDRELAWRKVVNEDYFIDFHSLGGADNAAAYCVVYVVAPDEIKNATLRIGSDDGSKFYLNGREVGKVLENRAVGKDQNAFGNLVLKKGTNVLLMKVTNGNGEWKGAARFTDANGAPIKGLKAQLTK